MVIDGIADGAYILVSTTNAQHTISEETYEDNSVKIGLRITEDSVANVNHLRTECLITLMCKEPIFHNQ